MTNILRFTYGITKLFQHSSTQQGRSGYFWKSIVLRNILCQFTWQEAYKCSNEDQAAFPRRLAQILMLRCYKTPQFPLRGSHAPFYILATTVRKMSGNQQAWRSTRGSIILQQTHQTTGGYHTWWTQVHGLGKKDRVLQM